jgi:predicted site-specific integrase-resolvase
MTTKEVAEKYGVSRPTVIQWCQKNAIKRKLGGNGVMEYIITEKDLKKFENRRGRGWKKGRSRKAE